MRKKELLYGTGDTIAALSTPVGEGGIGIVRMSGKKALSIADKIFAAKDGAKPSTCQPYTLHYGHVVRMPETAASKPPYQPRRFANGHLQTYAVGKAVGEIVDEVLLTVMRAPKSYTKEDIVEINCHGGIIPLRKILELVLSHGARLALPGEFTKRAFINGRIDLAQAEAVLDIIKSRTDASMKVALGHLEGELSRRINVLKDGLLDALGEIEAGIDFSDEDIEIASKREITGKLAEISQDIRKLINDARKGMIMKEGILCVICGKPNVGKSSLMNALLGRSRVIVTPVPGTTRDAIEEEINLQGVPVRLVDTAGISRGRNIVEKHGIRKSKSYIEIADLIFFILDLSRQWSKADRDIFNAIKDKNFIVIATKTTCPGSLTSAG